MMWEMLWMLYCLRAETLQGLKGRWEIPWEGVGGDLWVNAPQTHISASLGKDLASAHPGEVLGHPLQGFGLIMLSMDEALRSTECCLLCSQC